MQFWWLSPAKAKAELPEAWRAHGSNVGNGTQDVSRACYENPKIHRVLADGDPLDETQTVCTLAHVRRAWKAAVR